MGAGRWNWVARVLGLGLGRRVEVVVEEGEEEASRRWTERRVERVPRLFIGEGRGVCGFLL